MYYDEVKSIVGQNCEEYEPSDLFSMMSMSSSSVSCNMCSYFKDNKCEKGLFESLKNTISCN